MEAFTIFEGIGIPIDIINCDTDQIIPARFLRKDRTDPDMATFLWHDLRKDPNFIFNQILTGYLCSSLENQMDMVASFLNFFLSILIGVTSVQLKYPTGTAILIPSVTFIFNGVTFFPSIVENISPSIFDKFLFLKK